MMTRHSRVACVSLLAVSLLLTMAGCAAGNPVSGAAEQTDVGLVRLTGSGLLTPSPGDPGEDEAGIPGAELTCGAGSHIELVKDTAIEEDAAPVLTVTLTGLEFAESLEKEGFEWENLPTGLDFSAERVDGTTAAITLSGTPAEVMEKTSLTLYISKELVRFTDHPDSEAGTPGEINDINDIDDILEGLENDRITARGTVTISVQPSQLAAPDIQSAQLTGKPINLTAGATIQEGEEPVLTVTLTGLVFADHLDKKEFHWRNLPQGLDFTVARVDDVTAEIILSGTPTEAAEEAHLRLTIGKDQFQIPPEADVSTNGPATAVAAAAPRGIPLVVLILCGIVAAAAVITIVIVSRKRGSREQQDMPPAQIAKTENLLLEPERRDMSNKQNIVPTVPTAPFQGTRSEEQRGGMVQLGKLHNIGRRSGQQDSLGSINLDGGGVFAVVADGMGGLSGGEQISQGVVMSMLQQAGSLMPGQMDGALNAMVRVANDEINRKLGSDGIYRSGSTVVAVLLRGNVFHWISVGDSRIYLYRGGSMLQLNQEHTYEVELMQRVMNGEITAAEAANDPQRRGLTSFIGMGRLKYVDSSLRPVVLQSGDRILLMTDGVFNNLPEAAMADTLIRNPDVQQAARVLEEQVLALQDAAQDNFTAIILGFQG